ncbi:hypothetical protein DICSQDRAFT_155591 [Dichomitus squalens LYAD-421 SS1]|uniref:Uncharacterized protein n=2 Tax=Dichomitus squalens TaxID=114155 RepID=A0A4Q9PPL8_9APHY|nr:uncharacterized protein DICSQDRAFT_155591 [Dichomitus squalens LYAD-421 SS1]EJF60645.1 hypothetical protein DICSQDRAFT_155591 [Dichomitus squalens LYAD-421 SS1]TBU56299.1 hypothetical protein BD310DRAFT_960337 [Dichomitus squalens]
MATRIICRREYEELVQEREPPFAEVVYVLTTPPPGSKPWDLSSCLSRYMALLAYTLIHPKQAALWADNRWKIGETIEEATYAEVRREWEAVAISRVQYAFTVARLFVFAPQGPGERARRAFLRQSPVTGPPKDGVIRVKWYPDVESVRVWPEGFGQLWMDVPVDETGCADLRVIKDSWGMENCFVIDANRDRLALWRHPVEKLSALAINVLLSDGHRVIGVVERPSQPLLAARQYRAYVRYHMRPFVSETIPRLLGLTVARLLLVLSNLAIGIPYFLWFLLSCSPYILFRTLEIALLALYAVGAIVLRDLEELVYVLVGYAAPPAWVFRSAGRWLVAGLEAAFLTDEEINRRTREGSEMLEQ